jgi:hypothetical protein
MTLDGDGFAPRDGERARLLDVDGLTLGGKRRATAFSCTGRRSRTGSSPGRSRPARRAWAHRCLSLVVGGTALADPRRVLPGAEGRGGRRRRCGSSRRGTESVIGGGGLTLGGKRRATALSSTDRGPSCLRRNTHHSSTAMDIRWAASAGHLGEHGQRGQSFTGQPGAFYAVAKRRALH